MTVGDLIGLLAPFDESRKVQIEMRHWDLEPGEAINVDADTVDVLFGANMAAVVVIKAAP